MGKRFRYANSRGFYPQIKNHQLGWWIFIVTDLVSILVFIFFEMLSQIAHKSRKSVALSQSAVFAVLFKQIVVDNGIGGGRFVNPALVEIFCELAVCDDEFEFHKGGDVVVDAHNHGVCPVGVL